MKKLCDWQSWPTFGTAKRIMMNCWAKDGSEQKPERVLEKMLNGFVRNGKWGTARCKQLRDKGRRTLAHYAAGTDSATGKLIS